MPHRLPNGIQSFKVLRQENYLYVDKTRHIFNLINNAKYQFLSRPRRFGKSLLVDTMHHLFQGKRELFQNLWIEDHWDWDMQYPVIRMDFGVGVLSVAELTNTIDDILRTTSERFHVSLHSKNQSGQLQELIQGIAEKYNKPVVVLVDEYEKPLLDSITNIPQAQQMRDILKTFYSVLKVADQHLKFVFLTGVTKFSKVSLFSGLNNLKDLTLDERFGDICGITHQEILDNFSDYLDGVDMEKVRKWYNGFNFLGQHKVYNPFDLLLFFDSKEFNNYWFQTATPTFLIKKIQERQYFIPDLENIEAGDEIISSFDVENLSVETLLFQTGYLTIQKKQHYGGQNIYTLQYPNLEIKMSLIESILSYLVNDPVQKTRNQIALYKSLVAGDFDSMKQVFRQFFASIPHDWFRKNNLAAYEGYYASVVYSYFCGLGLDVIAEDTTNKGRIDLTVFLENNIFILEFKTEKTGKGALEQIRERKYWEKYLGNEKVNVSNENTPGTQPPTTNLYLIGIAFDEAEKNIRDFSWEKIFLNSPKYI